MTAEFHSAAQASAAEHEARIRSLRAERREAEEEAARLHAATMQGAQHAHKLEKVPLQFLRESSQQWCRSATLAMSTRLSVSRLPCQDGARRRDAALPTISDKTTCQLNTLLSARH